MSKPFGSLLTALWLSCLVATGARAQDVFTYPQKGQSREQQSKDKAECYQWAVNETGYNPSAPPPAPAAPPPQGGLVRGAARGALMGAAVGAIAGDTGKGAAIGATAGGMGGAMRRRDSQREADHYAQQNAAQSQAKADQHRRAMTACLEARGYSVK